MKVNDIVTMNFLFSVSYATQTMAITFEVNSLLLFVFVVVFTFCYFLILYWAIFSARAFGILASGPWPYLLK